MIRISVSAPALNSNGARRPRNGAKMADWAPSDSDPGRAPGKVYGDGLRAFMRLHRRDPAAAVRLLRPDYRPAFPDDPAAALDAYRAWMQCEVFPRWRWEFPSRNGAALRRWERRAGVIVRDDAVRLSRCGRRGGVESGARRHRARRPRDLDVWKWHRTGRGTLAIVGDIAADWPELQIGPRRVQQIVAERRERARARRRVKVERAAAERRRCRARRDAEIAQRVRAGGNVARAARSVGVSPATGRRACAAAGVPVSAALRAAAERDRAEAEWQAALADFFRRRARAPERAPLWKYCLGETEPHGAI